MATHGDPTPFLSDIRPEAPRNFRKLVFHILTDYMAYYLYAPVLQVLYYTTTGSLQLILIANTVYSIVTAVTLVAFSFIEPKLHQQTTIRIVLSLAMVSIAFISASLIYPDVWVIDVVAYASIGLYYGPLQIAEASLTCDNIDVTNPSADLNLQYMAEVGSPILSSVINIILFVSIGDEWNVATLRIIGFVALGMQLLSQGFLLTLKDLRYPPAEEDLSKESSAVVAEVPAIAAKDAEVTEVEAIAPALPSDAAKIDGDVDAALTSVGPNPLAVGTAAAAPPAPAKETTVDNGRGGCLDSWLRASFLVPLAALTTALLYMLAVDFCFAYLIYFVTADLGLAPVKYFAFEFSLVASCILLAALFGEVAERIPSTRFIAAATVLAPVAMWFLAIAQDSLGIVPFLIAVVVHAASRDSCAGLCRAVVVKYAPPSTRILWNGLGVLGAKYAGSFVGFLLGGIVNDSSGFRSTLVPTACIVTVGWLCSLLLVLAPSGSAIESEEERLAERLAQRNMGQVLVAREQMIRRNFRTFLALMRAKRALMNVVVAYRARKRQQAAAVTTNNNDTTMVETILPAPSSAARSVVQSVEVSDV